MRPGSRWVYRETDAGRDAAARGGDRDRPDEADRQRGRPPGSSTTWSRERGKLVEVTDDWYAQDRAGNVWYLGEATTEYEDGEPVSTDGSFEAGVDGAQAGVIMPARPRRGLRYRQEYSAGEAEDKARVVSVREQAEVPFGHFRRVLMTRDVNPLEPKVLEFKFYARGVGPVLAISVSGSSDREELVRYTKGRG